MKIFKVIFIQFTFFLLFFLVADNLIFSMQESKVETLSLNFRHSAYENYSSAPTQFYRSISNDTLDTGEKRFRTGRYGEVLGQEYSADKYESLCKIAILGGSSTETRWVAESERWPVWLENTLKEKGVTASVFNFGVGGQNVNHSLIRYIGYIASLKPDYILVMNEANDLGKFIKGGYYIAEGDLHNSYSREKDEPNASARLKSLVNSALPFSYNLWRTYRNRQAKKPPARAESHGFNGLDAIEASKRYSSRLLALNSLVNANDGKLLLIEYPEVYESVLMSTDSFNEKPRSELVSRLKANGLSSEDFLEYVEKFRGLVAESLAEEGVGIIKKPAGIQEDSFYDAIHFNGQGSKYFAEYLAKELISKQVCF